MTWALCCSCGDIKFGAICPCPKCQVASTGDMQLDIVFSDHYIDPETLKDLGGVIKAINARTEIPSLRFAAFFYYISEYHPSILKYKPPAEEIPEIINLLEQLDLPIIQIKPGRNGWHDNPSSSTENLSPGEKKWWQFWRRGP